ncbi:MAG: hypothetical protein PHG67_08625 [Bacteroidales bacterium]|nr:hypothetical protein [Bacteroidales bacterium]MDY0086910.1 hypothetical protein [Bacteroidales bacterium]HOI32225.1 hypothetical protein [Bacteroidales bacterium]
METFLIIFSIVIVIASTVLSFYSSINSGAAKMGKWFEKHDKNKT